MTDARYQGRSTRDVQISTRDTSASASWQIVAEEAVEISINGLVLGVMMATPSELEDLALGFVFTEGVLLNPQGVIGLQVEHYADGWIVAIDAQPEVVNTSARRARLLEGRAGCGLCGVDSLTAAMRQSLIARRNAAAPSDEALTTAFQALPGLQPLNQATHSAHAAAWCNMRGDIIAVREDVWRHNALDKLVGWRLGSAQDASLKPTETPTDLDQGFVVMTSRLSFELVGKAAALGATGLAAVSAPTTLALELAKRINMPLACLGPNGTIVRF